MAHPNMSEAEEMYMITLAKLAERGVQSPVPLTLLAEELAVLPVSANQMVHKLEQEGILDYVPYKGVAMRPEGRRLANRTLRRRRLWELFLVDRLGLPFAEADALACRMEHITSAEVTERLAVHGDSRSLPQRMTGKASRNRLPKLRSDAFTRWRILVTRSCASSWRPMRLLKEPSYAYWQSAATGMYCSTSMARTST